MAKISDGYDVKRWLDANLDSVKWVSGGPHDDLVFDVAAGARGGKSGAERIGDILKSIEASSSSKIWAYSRELKSDSNGERTERVGFRNNVWNFSVRSRNPVVAKAMNADEWEKVYQIKGLPVKFVYRGSPYNDIKATIEGGNRDYIPVGRIIASAPISQVEAEKLASAKWRQIKKTARNANAARSRNSVVAKALNAVAKNGRDASGFLTVGTKVKFGNGGTGEIIKVKRIYSHGFVEPEYTIKSSDGRTFIENEGRFEVVGNAVVQNALAAKNAAANAKSAYQIESDLERKIGAKIGKEVSVGIEGDALSVDIANESDTDKVLDVVRRELGEIKAYRYVNNGDIPYLAVTLKNGIAANAQIENTRTLSVSKQAWTKSELKGIEVMKKHLASHRGVLPRTTKEVDDVLGMIPDIDTTEKQNVMSYFKYGRGKSLVANSIKDDVAKVAKMVGRELTPNEEKSARILLEAGEPASRVASSIQSMAPNADTGVIRKTAVNGAGYVDASTVMIRPGDAVVFKAGYRLHSDDDDWLERNGDTVREVRGDEVKLGPSANDWAKIKDLMVWHNSRSTNAVRNAKFKVGDRVKYTGRDILIYGKPGSVGTIKSVDTDWFGGYPIYEVEFPGARLTDSIGEERLTLANSRVCNAVVQNALNAAKSINAVGRDKQDAASVEMWAGDVWNNFLTFALPKFTDKERARKNGEKIIKYVEDALGSEGGKAQLKKMGLTIQKMRDALEKGLDTVAARNATTKRVARNAIEKFEVGKIYRAPWDREWLAKVLSRTASSIKVAIKSVRDKTWHSSDEQVTLRINPRKSEELGAEVAAGWDWEFWADNKA